MSINQFVFIPDPTELFKPAEVISNQNGELKVKLLKGSTQVFSVKASETFPAASIEEIENPPSDLILLSIVHGPLILYTLRHHFMHDKIYTNVGQILVAVNPFKWIEGIYGEPVMQQYVEGSISSTENPHVFALARDAYEGLERGKNQSLIIIGESGAGKTEATKQCLKYLAFAAGSKSGVEEKILQSSPILEAWGNAKTLRNDNSSRFGKFIEIWFGKKVDIVGSSNTTYLLEKSRVVFQEKDERNYHVFYQIIFGAPAEVIRELRLQDMAANPQSVQFINQSGCVHVETINDERDYRDMQNAFVQMGFLPDEPVILNRIIAAILHMGNVAFAPNPAVQDELMVAAGTEASMVCACELWGVDLSAARSALLFKKVLPRYQSGCIAVSCVS